MVNFWLVPICISYTLDWCGQNRGPYNRAAVHLNPICPRKRAILYNRSQHSHLLWIEHREQSRERGRLFIKWCNFQGGPIKHTQNTFLLNLWFSLICWEQNSSQIVEYQSRSGLHHSDLLLKRQIDHRLTTHFTSLSLGAIRLALGTDDLNCHLKVIIRR